MLCDVLFMVASIAVLYYLSSSLCLILLIPLTLSSSSIIKHPQHIQTHKQSNLTQALLDGEHIGTLY